MKPMRKPTAGAAIAKLAIGRLLLPSPIVVPQYWAPPPPSDPRAREMKL